MVAARGVVRIVYYTNGGAQNTLRSLVYLSAVALVAASNMGMLPL
jgi:hypothetical protein